MHLSSFHSVLTAVRGFPLTKPQRAAVDHPASGLLARPLWILAGPGSGKSEVLIARTLKLLLVDEVEPASILLTTFTRKAQRSLEERLATYLAGMQRITGGPVIDTFQIQLGTLHGLCADILHEYRHPPYQNVRLMNGFEQALFVYRHAHIVKLSDRDFWRRFECAVPAWTSKRGHPPSRWQRAKAAITLFNRLVEDRIDLDSMKAHGGSLAALIEHYRQYVAALRRSYRCDFAHLQQVFVDFLATERGQEFLAGHAERPPLRHVLVDEYQDTNPIQERIYLALAGRAPHSLTVVGDDDQALYRFRGGTVSCMVHFNRACEHAFGVAPRRLQLIDNHRSHRIIVTYCNDYITRYSEMKVPGVRAPDKQPMRPHSAVRGEHPAVSWLHVKKVADLGEAVAEFVDKHLLGDRVVEDPSQIALLLPSVRDTPRNAGPYLRALERRGIEVYNPRAKTFMETEEVRCLLAAVIELLDPEACHRTLIRGRLNDQITLLRQSLADLRQEPGGCLRLDNYLRQSHRHIRELCAKHPDGTLDLTILDAVWRVLSLEPFATWRLQPTRRQRLSKLSRLLESYRSLGRDRLRVNAAGTWLHSSFLSSFYYTLLGYLFETGIDEDEDEEFIVPRGMLPVMTIHQAKGLEFPFVIVGQVGKKGRVGAAQHLEQDLAPFRRDLYPRTPRSPDELALQDDIRLRYVAYSRAQYGLILAGTEGHMKKHVAVPGGNLKLFRRDYPRISP